LERNGGYNNELKEYFRRSRHDSGCGCDSVGYTGREEVHSHQHNVRGVHELSIAISIIEGVEEEVARQGGGKVCSVNLKLGPLSGVVKEALLFSFELACEGTSLEGSRLIIEEIPISVYCSKCAAESDPVSGQCLHCARCGTSACHVVKGMELELASLELES
jgi:hydrogenase nickel incorporation protein HypA/HybF